MRRSATLFLEILAELFAQVGAGAEEEAFYCGHAEIEDFGDVLVGRFVVAAHDDGHALGFGQFVDGALDGGLHFVVEQRCIRRLGARVGDLQRAVVIVRAYGRSTDDAVAGVLESSHLWPQVPPVPGSLAPARGRVRIVPASIDAGVPPRFTEAKRHETQSSPPIFVDLFHEPCRATKMLLRYFCGNIEPV